MSIKLIDESLNSRLCQSVPLHFHSFLPQTLPMSAFFLNSHMNLFFINLCYISIPVNLNLSLVFSYFLIHASILLISYCFLKRVKNMLIQGSWVFRLRTQSHFLFSQCVMMGRYRGQWDCLHCVGFPWCSA